MYLYKVVTITDIIFYVNSEIETLSEFTKAAEKHFNYTQLRSVECLGKPIIVKQ